MASAVDICNAGLGLLGARTQINSINPPDGSAESGYCARYYPFARKELIETGAWAFARRRIALSEVANASDVWQYAYATPAGISNALRVLAKGAISNAGVAFPLLNDSNGLTNWTLLDRLLTERGSQDFDIEDGVIYTNEPEAVLLYTADVTDTTRFSAMFTTTLGMLMASYLAGPIIKGLEGAKVAQVWRDAAMSMSARAEASDANSTSQRAEHVPDFMAGRM